MRIQVIDRLTNRTRCVLHCIPATPFDAERLSMAEQIFEIYQQEQAALPHRQVRYVIGPDREAICPPTNR